MKHKRFDHKNWPRALSDQQTVHVLPEGILVDYLAHEVVRPLVVLSCGRQVTVLASHYRWVHFAPFKAHHALTVQLDAQDRAVQYYIDINLSNEIAEDGIPVGLDLYLDVVALVEDWKVLHAEVIDQEELEEAVHLGKVTPEQARFAQQEALKMLDTVQREDFASLVVIRRHLNTSLTRGST